MVKEVGANLDLKESMLMRVIVISCSQIIRIRTPLSIIGSSNRRIEIRINPAENVDYSGFV